MVKKGIRLGALLRTNQQKGFPQVSSSKPEKVYWPLSLSVPEENLVRHRGNTNYEIVPDLIIRFPFL